MLPFRCVVLISGGVTGTRSSTLDLIVLADSVTGIVSRCSSSIMRESRMGLFTGKMGVSAKTWKNLCIQTGQLDKTHFLDAKLGAKGGRLKTEFPRSNALKECKDITVESKLAQPSITQSFQKNAKRRRSDKCKLDDLINLVQNISLIPMQGPEDIDVDTFRLILRGIGKKLY
ncbi:hypothetical protein Tco_1002871 [Tanacetum coccineum]|uniref:Uncharacterized protein n=1 Tax=Tanacetum coccineum TaxID=301880 RepID=A0ABQ5F7I3_9ASTR